MIPWATVDPIELLWLFKCLAMLYVNLRMLAAVAADDRQRIESGLNGSLEIQSFLQIWTFRLGAAAQTLGVILVIPSLLLEPRVNVDPNLMAWLVSNVSPFLLVVLFILFDAQTLLAWYTRHRLGEYFRFAVLRDKAAALVSGLSTDKRRTDVGP
jgi:hypothetical protein